MSLFNLTFLAPLALLGLAALAVPIYLHMRHKPRAEVYKFPAIDFLLKAQKKRKRRFRTEQLLLMLFRIGIIMLMAFLFAKPFIDEQFGTGESGNNQPMVILLDDTPSMLAGPANARFFDEAKSRIDELLSKRSAGSPVRLIRASKPGRDAEADTTAAVRELLGEIKATTAHHTLDEGYQTALDLIAAKGWDGATLQIFTDGSRGAWQSLPERKPDGLDVIYTSMREGIENFHNVGITSVAQSPGDNNSVEVSLRHSGKESRTFNLGMRGEGMSSVGHQMRLDANSGTSHYFALPETVPPRLGVTLPADNFDLDNEVLFVPRPNRLTKILIVDGDTHPEPINSESFFLKNALGFEDSEKYGFQFQVVTPVGLTEAAVAQVDVVMVLNVDMPATKVLNSALAQGKGVFLGMGERMDFERWNEFMRGVNLEMWEVKGTTAPQPLNVRDFDHPFFGAITELEWRSYLGNVGIRNFRLVSTGRSSAQIPLALGDGSPLLLTQEANGGRLMVWTSSMDVDWNNFPLEFGYVPFVRQAVIWLASRDSENAYQSLTVGEVIEQELQDSLILKHTSNVFENLDHEGPKPGIYTRVSDGRTEFVQVALNAREMDFADLSSENEDGTNDSALADLGFRSYVRTDLAPGVQWLLFLLLLVETLVAGRITLSWGAR